MEASTFCTHCGQAVDQDSRFCIHCGQDVLTDTEGTQSAETQAGAIAFGSAADSAPAAVMPRRQTTVPDKAVPPPSARSSATRPPRSLAPPAARPPWLAAGISSLIVLVVAVIVVIALIATGGKPAAHAKSLNTRTAQLTNALLASRLLYASTQQPSYSALLPAGWQQVTTKLPNLNAATTVQSPVDDGATITVGQIPKPTTTLRAEAKRVLNTLSSAAGFKQQASSATHLIGGRPAWAIAYSSGELSTAYYLVRSCGSTYAISATVPAARVALLRARIQIVAGTLQGNC